MQDLNNVHAKPLATLQVEVNNNSVWLHFRESCVSLETHTACERQVTRARNAPCFVAFLVCVCMLLLWVLWVHSINWEKGQKRKTSALLCFLIPCDATAPVQSRSCTHNAHNISCKNKLNFFTLKPRYFSRHLSSDLCPSVHVRCRAGHTSAPYMPDYRHLFIGFASI